MKLSPLPCWRDLSSEQQRQRIVELVGECDAEAAERRERSGKQPMGAAAVLRQQPHAQPATTKKSTAPLFHAASKRVRGELYVLYRRFVAAFREASTLFPDGCFPPAPSFVGG